MIWKKYIKNCETIHYTLIELAQVELYRNLVSQQSFTKQSIENYYTNKFEENLKKTNNTTHSHINTKKNIKQTINIQYNRFFIKFSLFFWKTKLCQDSTKNWLDWMLLRTFLYPLSGKCWWVALRSQAPLTSCWPNTFAFHCTIHSSSWETEHFLQREQKNT
jgi:hypothetical protein